MLINNKNGQLVNNQNRKNVYSIFILIIIVMSLTMGACDITETASPLYPGTPNWLTIASLGDKTTFNWTSVTDATRYELQISENLESLSNETPIEVSDTHHEAILEFKTYFWRVRAINVLNLSGPWSAIQTINITLPRVGGLQPINNHFSLFNQPEFSWNPVSNATQYEFQIAKSKDVLAKTPVQRIDSPTTTYTPTTKLSNLQTYYWRVRCINQEIVGDWSETLTLHINWGAVTNLQPEDGSKISIKSPELSWDLQNNANKYLVQMAESKEELLTAPSTEVFTLPYIPSSELANLQTYYWRVQAVIETEVEQRAWSQTQSFLIETSTPTNLFPIDVIDNTKPVFTWDAVDDAAQYHIKIAESEVQLLTVTEVTVDTNSYTPDTALYNLKSYYWQVRAIGNPPNSITGEWTASVKFEIQKGAVTGLKPDTSTITEDTTPDFSWNAVQDAEKYEFQIAETIGDLDSAPLEEVQGTKYTPSSYLKNAQTFYWRVRSIDVSGQAGAWSSTPSIYINWGVVTGLQPDSSSRIADNTPEFSWNVVNEAIKYEFQLAETQESLEVADIQTVTAPTNSYTITHELNNLQSYLWRVRAINPDNQASEWSTSQVDMEIELPTGLSPNTTVTTTRPTFSWSTVKEATHYDMRIADSIDGLEGAIPVRVTVNEYSLTRGLTNLKTHYWQIRAVRDITDKLGLIGEWSPQVSVPVSWGEINNLQPSDATVTENTKPTFSWDPPESGASKYVLQMAKSVNELEFTIPIELSTTSYTPSNGMTNLETHSWRVRAVDDEGQEGVWSNINTIQINWGSQIDNLAPPDATQVEDTTPDFSWDAVVGAVKYEFRSALSADELSQGQIFEIQETKFTPPSGLPNAKTNYWQVRPIDSEGQGGKWSNPLTIEINWGSVYNLKPANAEITMDTYQEFTWDAVTNAVAYEIRIAEDTEDIANANVHYIKAGTSYIPKDYLSNLKTHNWQVRAIDSEDQAGPWTVEHTLSVSWGTLANFVPDDLEGTNKNRLTLSWDSPLLGLASKYELQIVYDIETDNTVPPLDLLLNANSIELTTAEYAIPQDLTYAKDNYWRVRAFDRDGQTGPWSDPLNFMRVYSIGDIGPGGGIIFYDAGQYSNGWRWMEVGNQITNSAEWHPDGYQYPTFLGTSSGIGAGKTNTETIYNHYGTGSTFLPNWQYPARIAHDLTEGGKNDWFLPSFDEVMELIKVNAVITQLGGSVWLGTSTESDADNFRTVRLLPNGTIDTPIESKFAVRYIVPVRQF